MTSAETIAPIGIIDSGVGGLSVLKEIHTRSSGLSLHYIADSAWCPYGSKSATQITERVTRHTDHLLSLGCGTIVIACNSATISSIEELRERQIVPFVGMEPAIKPAAKVTRSGVIGVLATEASLAGKKFHRLVNEHGKDVKVITSACPDFVSLVEQGILSGEKVTEAIKHYVNPLLDQGADTLVLGCTHYPFLRDAIEQFTGTTVTVLDTGAAVATRTLDQAGFIKTSAHMENRIHISTSGELPELQRILPILCPGMNVHSTALSYA